MYQVNENPLLSGYGAAEKTWHWNMFLNDDMFGGLAALDILQAYGIKVMEKVEWPETVRYISGSISLYRCWHIIERLNWSWYAYDVMKLDGLFQ
jgi:hypothetical protein